MTYGLVVNSVDGSVLVADDLDSLVLQTTITMDNVGTTVTPPTTTMFGGGNPLSSTLTASDVGQVGSFYNPVLSSDTEFLSTGISRNGGEKVIVRFGDDDEDDVVKELQLGTLEMQMTSVAPFGSGAYIQVTILPFDTIAMDFTTAINKYYYIGAVGTIATRAEQFAILEHPLKVGYIEVVASAGNGQATSLAFGVNNKLSARLISGEPTDTVLGTGSVLKNVNIPGIAEDPPIVFIEPTDSTLYYAEVYRNFNGVSWDIGIMQSGTTMTASKLHIYGKTKVVPSTSSYGLQLKNSVGEVTFDSRLSPLQIIGSATGVSPTYPPISGNPTTVPRVYDFGEGRDPFPSLDHNMAVGQPNSISVPTIPSPVMYSIPSIATASYTRYHEYKWYDTEGWLFTWRQKHNYYKAWSVFYRQGFRLSGSSVDFGWIPYKLSFKERRKYASSGDPFSDDNVDATTGTLPYYDATTNNTPVTVLVAVPPV